MVAYRFADFVRVERWVDLALSTYLYLEWYRWGRLERSGLEEEEGGLVAVAEDGRAVPGRPGGEG